MPKAEREGGPGWQDRKSTRLNSSHGYISYAVFCLKKKSAAFTLDYTAATIHFRVPRGISLKAAWSARARPGGLSVRIKATPRRRLSGTGSLTITGARARTLRVPDRDPGRLTTALHSAQGRASHRRVRLRRGRADGAARVPGHPAAPGLRLLRRLFFLKHPAPPQSSTFPPPLPPPI